MKITIGGETFDYDETSHPLSEALAIEKECGHRYAEYETELVAGAAWARAVFAWSVWRREGRDVPLEDLLSGKTDFDYGELERSLRTAAAEKAAAEEDPTPGAVTPTAPDGTDGTSSDTRASSPRSSASRRGTSGS